MVVSFFVGPGSSLHSSTRLLLCSGKASALASSATAAALSTALSPRPLPALFDRVLEASKPVNNASKGKADTLWTFSTPDAEDGVRLVVHTLPEATSRHNSSGRPDDVVSFLESNLSHDDAKNGPIRIVLAVKDANEAFAAGCAVARALPMFSRKGGQTGKEDCWRDRCVEVGFVVETDPDSLNDAWLKLMLSTATAIRDSARLSDMPCSQLHTDAFVREAKAVVDRLDSRGVQVRMDVIEGEDLNRQGFGGLWAVGKAALWPPFLVVLSYEPAEASNATADRAVVWAGKGIVYDTGGLSIKGKTDMPGMKRDMSAAASILFAFEAACSNGINRRLHAVLCLAENAVGPLATRPDDILLMYSGKSVEVNNTDAEGRLVLADGVAYASKHLDVKTIVDMATLTGAQGVATGQHHAALYCDSDALEALALSSGRLCGDLVHPLPFAPEFYAGEFHSDVADMKNSVACRSNAQSSCAGEFIRSHLHSDYAGDWLHVDMAYPAVRKERGTGFGVALLLQMFHQSLSPDV